MEFILRELDDPASAPCGSCINCTGNSGIPRAAHPSRVNEAQEFLDEDFSNLRVPSNCPPGSFSSFPWQGRIPFSRRPREGRILARWGVSGWGSIVATGKQEGVFSDPLVEAAAQLVHAWSPGVTWVTCVPSMTRPQLVPDFALRLANRLNLPFRACLRKVRQTEPQKSMQNGFHQAHNLDGAFGVDAGLLESGPVLLIDDLVDSGWTFAVTSALLLEAGSGPVHPLALASAASQ